MAVASIAQFIKPKKSYFICTSPRSGSWLLADGLQSTKIAGRPREWFHKVAEDERTQKQNMPHPSEAGYTEYMDYVLRSATTPNGVFGLKCHWYQLELLPAKLATIESFGHQPLHQALPRLFPNLKFIWLTRRNKIRQAVSLDRARQTGAWWHEESFSKKLPVLGDEVYDPIMIDQAERHLLANEIGWQNFFKVCRSKPMLVVYEDLVEKYDETIREVLRFLELPAADRVAIPPTKMKPQSDGKTDEWLEKYLAFQKTKKEKKPEELQSTTGRRPPRAREHRRQIGQSKLVGLGDKAIVEMLMVQGVPRRAAVNEVRFAATNPFLLAGQDVAQKLHRLESVFSTYRELAKLDPDRLVFERHKDLSAAEFVKNFYAANRPVVLTDMSELPSLSRWTPEYLKSLAPDQMVDLPPKPGEKLANGSVTRNTKVPFVEFVERIVSPEANANLCFAARYDFFKGTELQAIFDESPMWPELLDAAQLQEGVSIGLEPSGFASRLRHESNNVLLLQLHGEKTVKLIPSYQTDVVYGRGDRTSEVNPVSPDLKRFPKYRDATVIEVGLKPGETLFVPVGWWHAELAAGVNISMTFSNFKFPNRFISIPS